MNISAAQKMLLRKRTAHGFTVIVRWIFLLALSFILLYPLLYMISGSVKAISDFSDPTVTWIPKNYSLDSFARAAEALNLWPSLKNTLVLEIVSALIEIVTCSIAAYGMARFEFRGKKLLMFSMILTILVPEQLTAIPTLLNFRQLDFLGILRLIGMALGTELRPNILDTPLTFYLPSLFAVGLRGGLLIFIYMQFFKGLPKELEEAAWIDGAGPIRTFIRIIVPSSGVVLVTVFLFSFIWHWNDYYLALIYTLENRPLAVQLYNIFSALSILGYGQWTYQAVSAVLAACLIFIAVPLLIYIILQRKFIQSIDRVGIVG